MASSKEKSTQRKEVEWLGEIFPMPSRIENEGESFQPEGLFWLGPDGHIVGLKIDASGALLAQASASLRESMARPTHPGVALPTRIRVASPTLAICLRAEFPGLDIVCEPTPEFERLRQAIHERVSVEAEAEIDMSYTGSGMKSGELARLFADLAQLFRGAPWKVVPSDADLITLSVPSLGVQDWVVSVIGQMRQNFGLILFPGVTDFAAFVESSVAVGQGRHPEFPAHLALNFESKSGMPSLLRSEIVNHGWEVARGKAYPWICAAEHGLAMRPLERRDFILVHALARALLVFLREEKAALAAVWAGEGSLTRTLQVETFAGACEVVLGACASLVTERPAHPVLGKLFDLAVSDDEDRDVDAKARLKLEAKLWPGFLAAPEAVGRDAVMFCPLVFEFAATYFGDTIATLRAAELRRILLELIPRKACIPPAVGRKLVAELAAFYAYLDREFALEPAQACRQLLNDECADKVAAALANPAGFGLGKSIVAKAMGGAFKLDADQGRPPLVPKHQPGFSGAVEVPPPGPKRTVRGATSLVKKKKGTTSSRKH